MSKENVFIVRYGFHCETDHILGVFSSKKLAKEQMEKLTKKNYDYCYIEKFKIEKPDKGIN